MVQMLPTTVAALVRHRDRQGAERLAAGDGYQDHGFVFADARGEPLPGDGVTKYHWRPMLVRLHLPSVKLHGARHTCATLLFEAGAEYLERVAADDALQFLLWFCARREAQAEMSLTVMVGGTLVTGLIIGEDEYFGRVGTMFARETPGLDAEGRESLDRFWSTWAAPPSSTGTDRHAHVVTLG